MEFIKITINVGEEVIQKLKHECFQRNIVAGAIISVIGGIDECKISTMSKEDAKKDIFADYIEPLELFGCGEISNGEPHIHCTLGREDKTALVGHLHKAVVKNWFVVVYILIK